MLELRGLEGTNPLAFLAALGVLSLPTAHDGSETRLAWTDHAVPYACVWGYSAIDQIATRAMAERDIWREAVVIRGPVRGLPMDDVKLKPSDLRPYIEACRDAGDHGRSAALVAALVAEGALDNNGVAKPTDLHFTAGQQRFLRMATELVEGLERADVEEALDGPWRYERELPSFMWDVTDDRVYALAAFNPSGEKKRTVPGAEFLALLGLRALPMFANGARAATTACSGTWKRGSFSWPLWSVPATFDGARTIVAHAGLTRGPAAERARWLTGWGVRQIWSCGIRRSEQGGYGSFAPPTSIWELST
jgi:hypothetical protein